MAMLATVEFAVSSSSVVVLIEVCAQFDSNLELYNTQDERANFPSRVRWVR